MKRTAQPAAARRAAIAPHEALAFGVALAVGSVVVMGLGVNWLAAAILAGSIFFYAVIYTVWLKRADAAEYRHRRRCGRVPAADRLGGGDGRRHRAAVADVRDYLPVDPAALLEPRAVHGGGLRHRWRTDAPRRRRRGGDAPADPPLYAGPRAGDAAAMGARPDRLGLWRVAAATGRDVPCPRCRRLLATPRRLPPRWHPRRRCSNIRCSICSSFSPRWSPTSCCCMKVDWTPEQTAEFNRRRRSRNLALGIFLGALVLLFFGITVVQDDQMTHGAARQSHDRAMGGGLCRRDGRPRLCQRAAVPRLLCRDRFCRHHRRGRHGRGAGGGDASIKVRFDGNIVAGDAVDLRPRHDAGDDPLGGRRIAFFRATNLSATRDHRAGGIQRLARPCR